MFLMASMSHSGCPSSAEREWPEEELSGLSVVTGTEFEYDEVEDGGCEVSKGVLVSMRLCSRLSSCTKPHPCHHKLSTQQQPSVPFSFCRLPLRQALLRLLWQLILILRFLQTQQCQEMLLCSL